MIVAEFKTKKAYKEANLKAHKTLLKVEGYNSPMYASETPLESIKGTYLLHLVEKFNKYLDLEWKEIDNSYIKKVEL